MARAAVDSAAPLAGTNDGGEIATLGLRMGVPCPDFFKSWRASEARRLQTSQRTGKCSILGAAAKHRFLGNL